MLSRMLNDARPVRIVAISCCRSESAFSILVLMLASISFTELNTGPLGAACCSGFIAKCLHDALRLMNYSTDGFTHRHTHYIAYHVQIENDNRKLIVAAHGNRSSVHHPQGARQYFQIRDFGELHRVGELEGILVVHSIHARGFGDAVGLELESPQRA